MASLISPRQNGAVNVLALYDIHGNCDALRAVLEDPRAAAPDVVVIGGDVVPGPFVSATLGRLRSIDAPQCWLRGNGEREVAEAVGGPKPAPDDLAALTSALTAAEIGSAQARELGDLPLTIVLDDVLYCHATPRRDDEMVTRRSASARWRAVLAGVDATLVVAGHTHQQDDRVVGDVRFVNAGSVGLPYEGDAAARWLWVADGEPHLRATPYDAAGVGARMLAAAWPDARSVNAALVDPMEPSAITEIFEARARADEQRR